MLTNRSYGCVVILSKCSLQEQDLLDRAPVLNNAAIRKEHGAADGPCCCRKQDTKNNRNDPYLRGLPLYWPKFIRCMIICHDNSCQTSKECKENYQVSPYVSIQNDHTCDQVDLQMQTLSYLILDIYLQSVEDLPSNFDRANDC